LFSLFLLLSSRENKFCLETTVELRSPSVLLIQMKCKHLINVSESVHVCVYTYEWAWSVMLHVEVSLIGGLQPHVRCYPVKSGRNKHMCTYYKHTHTHKH